MNDSRIEDVVRALGYLTLGTRLRRIGERLQAQTQRILDAHDLAIPAGQFPFLAAIDRLGPLTVGELAGAVGVTQPAATRSLGQLERAGFVEIRPAPDDQRRRQVALTRRGRRLVERGKRAVWPVIEGTVREICGGLSGPLLDQLAAIEDEVEARPLDQRVGARRRVRK